MQIFPFAITWRMLVMATSWLLILMFLDVGFMICGRKISQLILKPLHMVG
jgi:hypothetical protein